MSSIFWDEHRVPFPQTRASQPLFVHSITSVRLVATPPREYVRTRASIWCITARGESLRTILKTVTNNNPQFQRSSFRHHVANSLFLALGNLTANRKRDRAPFKKALFSTLKISPRSCVRSLDGKGWGK